MATQPPLMAMPRLPPRLNNVQVQRRRLQTGARVVLAHHAAADLLPRRLAMQRRRRPGGAAGGQLLVGDYHVHLAGVEVDAHPVAGLQQGEATAHGRFGGDVEDARAAGRAGLAAVAHRRQGTDAGFQEGGGRLHVHHLRAAGVADRAAVADDEDAALVDAERRVLDAVVVVLRAFEHDGAALEHVGRARLAKKAAAELGVDDADLHHRAVEQVAGQDREPGLLLHRLAVGADDLAIDRDRLGQVLAERLAGAGHDVGVQLAGAEQLAHHGRHAAGAEEALAEEAPGRLHVGQERDVGADPLPVFERVVDAHVPGDGDHADRAVAAGAERGCGGDGVLERGLGHDVGRAQVLAHHADDAVAGVVGHPAAFLVRPRNGGAAGQGHAEGFGQAVHAERRAHGIAVPGR